MTGLPAPEAGLVIRYSYLWRGEARAGREEGRKDRPCAVVLTTMDDQGESVVYVLPVTHTEPADEMEGLEIPLAIKRRIGLDDRRSWIVLIEANRFLWPGPDLRPFSREGAGNFVYGQLPPRFFAEMKRRWLVLFEARKMKIVPRTE